MHPRHVVVAGAVALVAALAGCGEPEAAVPDPVPSGPVPRFEVDACGGVTDADIAAVVGRTPYTKVVDNDAGCFWQEDTMMGSFGVGMGISTWWYRGSDLDLERTLERNAGRTLVELTVNGNKGFKGFDDNACSVYVTKGNDVITWSIQTLNTGSLPDLCSVAERLAQLSQDRAR